MRISYILLGALMLSNPAFAQGTVDFNNYTQNGGAGAPIWDYGQTGSLGAGPAFTAGLWVNGSLAGTTTFSSAPGFEHILEPVTITVSGIPGASIVVFEVKFWPTQFGTTASAYDAAVVAQAIRGSSGPFTGILGGAGDPPGPPSNLDNLRSFTLVPEPSTIALLSLAAVSMLFFRRSKSQ